MTTQPLEAVKDLRSIIYDDATVPEASRLRLLQALDRVATPLENDVWIYRTVVAVLGFTLIGTLIGGLALKYQGTDLPDAIVALGSAAVGALAGLLAPSPVAR